MDNNFIIYLNDNLLDNIDNTKIHSKLKSKSITINDIDDKSISIYWTTIDWIENERHLFNGCISLSNLIGKSIIELAKKYNYKSNIEVELYIDPENINENIDGFFGVLHIIYEDETNNYSYLLWKD